MASGGRGGDREPAPRRSRPSHTSLSPTSPLQDRVEAPCRRRDGGVTATPRSSRRHQEVQAIPRARGDERRQDVHVRRRSRPGGTPRCPARCRRGSRSTMYELPLASVEAHVAGVLLQRRATLGADLVRGAGVSKLSSRPVLMMPMRISTRSPRSWGTARLYPVASRRIGGAGISPWAHTAAARRVSAVGDSVESMTSMPLSAVDRADRRHRRHHRRRARETAALIRRVVHLLAAGLRRRGAGAHSQQTGRHGAARPHRRARHQATGPLARSARVLRLPARARRDGARGRGRPRC